MKLYHGTDYESAINIIKNGIDLSKSKIDVDFGAGFYTTTDLVKAEKRALFKAKNKKEKAYVVVIEVDDLLLNTLNVKYFENHDNTWGEFILHNRIGVDLLNQYKITTCNHNIDKKYDMVIGEIADGKVSSIAYLVKKGNISIEDVNFSDFLTDKKESYGIQISFHTQISLSCIKNIKYDIINQI